VYQYLYLELQRYTDAKKDVQLKFLRSIDNFETTEGKPIVKDSGLLLYDVLYIGT
jgi:hypothetical protein